MKRIALNFICKNEAHIIGRMLSSALPIIDLIVGIDTGSTDATISLIEQFGAKHHIPTFIYNRPFDNFCNSRNFALEMLKSKVEELGWPPSLTWGFTADCDETLIVNPAFNKQALLDDLYSVRHIAGSESFAREAIFRLDSPLHWESPIHEFLTAGDHPVRRNKEMSIEIKEDPGGASWKGDLVKKYLYYAEMLEQYLVDGHHNFRTLYFTGDSYSTAAGYCPDPKMATALYLKAQDYYDQALALPADGREVHFLLLKKIAENKQALAVEWPEVKVFLLAGFDLLVGKAETVAAIIEHYIEVGNWQTAHLYTAFCYRHFILNGNIDNSIQYRDDALYSWRLLFLYYQSSYHTGQATEAKKLYTALRKLARQQPEKFSEYDQIQIRINSPTILALRRLKRNILSLFRSLPNSTTSNRQPISSSINKMDLNYVS